MVCLDRTEMECRALQASRQILSNYGGQLVRKGPKMVLSTDCPGSMLRSSTADGGGAAGARAAFPGAAAFAVVSAIAPEPTRAAATLLR